MVVIYGMRFLVKHGLMMEHVMYVHLTRPCVRSTYLD